MNKAELVKAVSDKTNFTLENADTAVTAVIDILADCLRAHERITLHNLGTFKPTIRKARKYRRFQTGELYDIPQKRSYKLLVSPAILDVMNDIDTE